MHGDLMIPGRKVVGAVAPAVELPVWHPVNGGREYQGKRGLGGSDGLTHMAGRAPNPFRNRWS